MSLSAIIALLLFSSTFWAEPLLVITNDAAQHLYGSIRPYAYRGTYVDKKHHERIFCRKIIKLNTIEHRCNFAATEHFFIGAYAQEIFDNLDVEAKRKRKQQNIFEKRASGELSCRMSYVHGEKTYTCELNNAPSDSGASSSS